MSFWVNTRKHNEDTMKYGTGHIIVKYQFQKESMKLEFLGGKN